MTYSETDPRSVILNASVLKLGWDSGLQIQAVNSSGTPITNAASSSTAVNFMFTSGNGTSRPRLMNISYPQSENDAATLLCVINYTEPIPVNINEFFSVSDASIAAGYELGSANCAAFFDYFRAEDSDWDNLVRDNTNYNRIIPYTYTSNSENSGSYNTVSYYKVTNIEYALTDDLLAAYVTIMSYWNNLYIFKIAADDTTGASPYMLIGRTNFSMNNISRSETAMQTARGAFELSRADTAVDSTAGTRYLYSISSDHTRIITATSTVTYYLPDDPILGETFVFHKYGFGTSNYIRFIADGPTPYSGIYPVSSNYPIKLSSESDNSESYIAVSMLSTPAKYSATIILTCTSVSTSSTTYNKWTAVFQKTSP